MHFWTHTWLPADDTFGPMDFLVWIWSRVLAKSNGCIIHTSTKPAEPPATICKPACFNNGGFGFSDLFTESALIMNWSQSLCERLNVSGKTTTNNDINNIRSSRPVDWLIIFISKTNQWTGDKWHTLNLNRCSLILKFTCCYLMKIKYIYHKSLRLNVSNEWKYLFLQHRNHNSFIFHCTEELNEKTKA